MALQTRTAAVDSQQSVDSLVWQIYLVIFLVNSFINDPAKFKHDTVETGSCKNFWMKKNKKRNRKPITCSEER